MRISDLLENDLEHATALRDTGFWGRQGAGTIILAKLTKRFLLPERSADVEQPFTWGTWGGAIDSDESPEEAVARELYEEAGYHGPKQIIPLYVFKSSSFRYSNFLTIIPDEFTPRLNWETASFRWVEYGDWPQPLHFGLASVLKDPSSVRSIEQALQN